MNRQFTEEKEQKNTGKDVNQNKNDSKYNFTPEV